MSRRRGSVSSPPSFINSQDGSPSASRRSNGRSATNGSAARPATTQRGLAQTRRPARVASPDDEDEEVSEEEEDNNSTVVGNDRTAETKKTGLAREVYPVIECS